MSAAIHRLYEDYKAGKLKDDHSSLLVKIEEIKKTPIVTPVSNLKGNTSNKSNGKKTK